jgi:hypothetical protein
MSSERPVYLAGDAAVAFVGETCDSLGDLGQDPSTDRYPPLLVHVVNGVHALYIGYCGAISLCRYSEQALGHVSTCSRLGLHERERRLLISIDDPR